MKIESHILLCKLIFLHLGHTYNHNRFLKQAFMDYSKILAKNYLYMYIKLDYFYFSAFDLEVKATEILKYILPFSG